LSTYASQIKNLNDLLTSSKPTLDQIKSLSSTLKQLEIDNPRVMTGVHISDLLAAALAEARAADDIYGPNSVEATKCWDNAQLVSDRVSITGESSSSNKDAKTNRYKESAISSHHQYYTVVDPRSLEEAVEAIGKLEHLARQVAIEYTHLGHNEKGKMMP